MNIERTLFDARAQLTWGKSEKEVTETLLGNGIPEHIIREFITEVRLENNEDLREKGLKSIFISIPLLILATVGFILASWQLNGGPIIMRRLPVILILLCGCPGLYQLLTGCLDLAKYKRIRNQLHAIIKS